MCPRTRESVLIWSVLDLSISLIKPTVFFEWAIEGKSYHLTSMHKRTYMWLKPAASWERSCAVNRSSNLDLTIKKEYCPYSTYSNPRNQCFILLCLQKKDYIETRIVEETKNSLTAFVWLDTHRFLEILETLLCFQRSDNKPTYLLSSQIKLGLHTVPIHLHVACQQGFISTHQPILGQRAFGESCIGVYHIIYSHVIASEVLFTHMTQICMCVYN